MIIDDGTAARLKAARDYRDEEVASWVRAAFERGFDLRGLDDRDLRLACYNEYNRQLDVRSKTLPDEITAPKH